MTAAQTNSLGMNLVPVAAGRFTMGGGETPIRAGMGPLNYEADHPPGGGFDESPAHEVTISRDFLIGATPVTNARYEQFDAAHRALRGKLGFSQEDDEAVVFVSWRDAVRFCAWLSEKECRPYRLPTEAEWEYACRAGATTQFHTGDELPEVFHRRNRIEKWKGPAWYPDPRCKPEDAAVSLRVGQTPANAWGLHDVHGLVEEWCSDWYGPYEPGPQTDPVGRTDGEFRVTRGGSHSTDLYFLRSACRLATLPEDHHWLIGFRVVCGEAPTTAPLPPPAPSRCHCRVSQARPAPAKRDPARPYFCGPRRYVKIPPNSFGPMYSRHSHDAGICACPNGDLLAIWYNCIDEPGRELCLVASRLRRGEEEWEPASPFWDAPNRNNHAPALWRHADGTLYAFVGLAAGASWGNLVLTMRTSDDNGATWSRARIITPEHGPGITGHSAHMPIPSVIRTREGAIVLPCDSIKGSALHISDDAGETWREASGVIAGIHAGLVQINDGRLMALGRTGDIDGQMPRSVSADMGETWTYSPSGLPPIGMGQRLALLRLREGPLFLASFVGSVTLTDANGKTREKGHSESLVLTDAAGRARRVNGLVGALSFDDGATWPVRRLITGAGAARVLGLTYGATFLMNADTGEPQGYLAACQDADGIIHLIASQRHYAFNAAWLREPMPAA